MNVYYKPIIDYLLTMHRLY